MTQIDHSVKMHVGSPKKFNENSLSTKLKVQCIEMLSLNIYYSLRSKISVIGGSTISYSVIRKNALGVPDVCHDGDMAT